MFAFDGAMRATQGARNYQEDMAAIWPGADDPFLWSVPAPARANGELAAVLADGMGGHAGGALASRTVCERFLEKLVRGEGTSVERLLAALDAANAAVAAKVSVNPLLSGMGSTLVGVLFGPEGAEWVSVGDSPLLLYRRGTIAHLNEDHSFAPQLDRMAAAGKISAEEARRDHRRHMLLSAVTGEDIDLVDVSKRPLAVEAGDYVILASDGLHAIDDGEIGRVVSAHANEGPEAVAAAIIAAIEAVRDPHQDNATIVAVRALAAGA